MARKASSDIIDGESSPLSSAGFAARPDDGLSLVAAHQFDVKSAESSVPEPEAWMASQVVHLGGLHHHAKRFHLFCVPLIPVKDSDDIRVRQITRHAKQLLDHRRDMPVPRRCDDTFEHAILRRKRRDRVVVRLSEHPHQYFEISKCLGNVVEKGSFTHFSGRRV